MQPYGGGFESVMATAQGPVVASMVSQPTPARLDEIPSNPDWI
jgi:hypothetical protein